MSEPTSATRSLSLPGTRRRDVAVAGVRLCLHRADPPRDGGGTPTLLLHGVPQTPLMWRDLIPELAADRTVLAPDLKGLGRSEMRGPYDVPTMVAELAALVLHEVDQRVDVVGHDWGGTLATALAAARPELVRRLVVCSAPYRTLSLRHAWHIPFFALPLLPESVFALAGPAAVPMMIRAGWRSARPLDPDVLDHYVTAYQHPRRIGAMLAYYRAAFRRRMAGRRGGGRHGPPAPERTLVIWGSHDPVLPRWVGDAVAEEVTGPVSVLEVPGAGHFVVEEAPQVVVPAVVQFVREVSEAR